MNFQCDFDTKTLKVLMVNPLSSASQLLAIKILSGGVFGSQQYVDLTLLVYSNELVDAESFRHELLKCAFSCTSKINISSDLPRITDADVFCFMTKFQNPNYFDVGQALTDVEFDTLYLIIKIASNFALNVEDNETDESLIETTNCGANKVRKPIIVADGLISIQIIKTFCKDKISTDILFCPTSLTGISVATLGDYLKVKCNSVNDVFVWAANDEVFHVEVKTPVIKEEGTKSEYEYGDEVVTSSRLEKLSLDHTQFSASWMKKQFIQKVAASASKNPYGNIYRATEFAKTLKTIWMSRVDGGEVYANLGIISDGSVETMRGYPYVLPVILSGDTWTVNDCYSDKSHLKQEIKRMNKAVKSQNQKLIPFLKKFHEDNVIKQVFVPCEDFVSIQAYESTESGL